VWSLSRAAAEKRLPQPLDAGASARLARGIGAQTPLVRDPGQKPLTALHAWLPADPGIPRRTVESVEEFVGNLASSRPGRGAGGGVPGCGAPNEESFTVRVRSGHVSEQAALPQEPGAIPGQLRDRPYPIESRSPRSRIRVAAPEMRRAQLRRSQTVARRGAEAAPRDGLGEDLTKVKPALVFELLPAPLDGPRRKLALGGIELDTDGPLECAGRTGWIVQCEPHPRRAHSSDPRQETIMGLGNLGSAQAIKQGDEVVFARRRVERMNRAHAWERLQEERDLGLSQSPCHPNEGNPTPADVLPCDVDNHASRTVSSPCAHVRQPIEGNPGLPAAAVRCLVPTES
jgi:hypothetical protein